MNLRTHVFATLILIPHMVLAQQQRMFYKIVERDGSSHDVDSGTWVDPSVSNLNYDNYLPTIFGGTVTVRGSTQVGFSEFGDDLNLVGDVGVLDSMGMSISNRSLTNGFGLGQFTVRARSRADGVLLGQTSFAFNLNMPANTASFFSLPQGLFTNANIQLSPQVWLTVQWNFMQGATSAADIHGIYGAPQVLGFSSSIIRNFTSGVDTDLGGSPANSFMWYVTTSPLPAPGMSGLLLVLGLSATQRRR
jgi:hypothetical protein